MTKVECNLPENRRISVTASLDLSYPCQTTHIPLPGVLSDKPEKTLTLIQVYIHRVFIVQLSGGFIVTPKGSVTGSSQVQGLSRNHFHPHGTKFKGKQTHDTEQAPHKSALAVGFFRTPLSNTLNDCSRDYNHRLFGDMHWVKTTPKLDSCLQGGSGLR